MYLRFALQSTATLRYVISSTGSDTVRVRSRFFECHSSLRVFSQTLRHVLNEIWIALRLRPIRFVYPGLQ